MVMFSISLKELRLSFGKASLSLLEVEPPAMQPPPDLFMHLLLKTSFPVVVSINTTLMYQVVFKCYLGWSLWIAWQLLGAEKMR